MICFEMTKIDCEIISGALHREPTEPVAQQIDHQERKEEAGCRHADQGDDHRREIGEFVPVKCGDHSEWNADEAGREHGCDGKFDGIRERGADDGRYARLLGNRHTEVTGDGVLDKGVVLHRQRLIKPVLLANRGSKLRCYIVAEHDLHRVARRQTHDQKNNRERTENGEDRLTKSRNDLAHQPQPSPFRALPAVALPLRLRVTHRIGVVARHQTPSCSRGDAPLPRERGRSV